MTCVYATLRCAVVGTSTVNFIRNSCFGATAKSFSSGCNHSFKELPSGIFSRR